MSVFFKFRPATTARARERVLESLRKDKTGKVSPLFPGTPVADLEGHYVINSEPGTDVKALISMLSAMPEIEYAEQGSKRSGA